MGEPVCVGQCQLLHWWPPMMVAAAVVVGLLGGPVSMLVLLLPGVLVALVLPWRFAVLDGAIAL